MVQSTCERVVVIGAGAVGGSIGGLIAETGRDVTFVARGSHGEAIRRDGLSLRLPDCAFTVRAPCVPHVDDVDWRPDDVVLLATKLTDLPLVLDELRVAAGIDVPVVCATNGIHGEMWARERFRCVASMLVWLPATYLEDGEVRLHATGSSGVLDTGPTDGAMAWTVSQALCGMLRSAGFDAVPREDIERWKLAKLITNLGGAAQALVTDDWRTVAEAARAEGERVLDAVRLDRVPTDRLLERCAAVRIAPVDGNAREGGSTWQSRQRGRPLESPWIEGAISRMADMFSAPAPINTCLAEAARALRPLTADEVLSRA